MKNKTLYEEKMEDLCQVINLVRREYTEKGIKPTYRSLAEKAVLHPAKKFYISLDVAARAIKKIEKTKSISEGIPEKKELYAEIYARYQKFCNETDVKEGKLITIERIINSPAPQFYINPKYVAQQIRYFYNKRKKCK